jgi:membrane-associated protease RseP (regulator of RpoE activity)
MDPNIYIVVLATLYLVISDGGHLVLIAFEKLRGRAASKQRQLIRSGNWVVAVVTIVTSVLLLPLIVSGVAPLF